MYREIYMQRGREGERHIKKGGERNRARMRTGEVDFNFNPNAG